MQAERETLDGCMNEEEERSKVLRQQLQDQVSLTEGGECCKSCTIMHNHTCADDTAETGGRTDGIIAED